MKKILIGSPIRQKPLILKYFLESLKRLDKNQNELHYLFIDDNTIELSKNILRNFSRQEKNVKVVFNNSNDEYLCDNDTHYWTNNLMWKVAALKNIILQTAVENEFDYVFLIDSDLVLHPDTLNQLLKAEKDIISNIFWTHWKLDMPKLPQVWLFDEYGQFQKKREEILSTQEIEKRHNTFLNMLKKPGIYEVGGLGACTLISNNALNSGVNFKEIKNLSFMGEDRHFSIRAQALGFDLFVETQYPSFHIYREEDLKVIDEYIESSTKEKKNLIFKCIEKTVIQGIEELGTVPQKNENWKQYFTPEYSNLLAQKDDDVSEGMKVKAHVYDVIVTKFENHHVNAEVTFTLKNEINKNKIDQYSCVANLIKIHTLWLIDEIRIIEGE